MESLDQFLIRALVQTRYHVHEMRVRRNYSPAELTGHFCTELRRHLAVINAQNPHVLGAAFVWADTRAWNAPFQVAPGYVWRDNRALAFNGSEERMSEARMQSLCNAAMTVDDDELALRGRLSALAAELPALQRKTIEAERITREATALLGETTTFAASLK